VANSHRNAVNNAAAITDLEAALADAKGKKRRRT
jgi:hypothetical protein